MTKWIIRVVYSLLTAGATFVALYWADFIKVG